MSELKLLEFRERAVDGVGVPDFGGIERRGKGLRRRRLASAAGATALVLAAGAGILTTLDGSDPDTAPPATDPTPTAGPEVRTRMNLGEPVLREGRSTATYDGFTVSFDVPGPRWEWWGVGMGKRSRSNKDDYRGAVFFLADPVARQRPCSDKKVRLLGRDPEALVSNVEPLLHLAGTRVLEPPRVIGVLGGVAVHLKLETTRLCPDDGALVPQLSGRHEGAPVSPGFDGPARLELWHVVLPGSRSVLVASWDLDATDGQRTEQQALLRSIRIEAD